MRFVAFRTSTELTAVFLCKALLEDPRIEDILPLNTHISSCSGELFVLDSSPLPDRMKTQQIHANPLNGQRWLA